MQSTADSFENLRKDFPVLNRRVRDDKKLVYFDNAATTQKPCLLYTSPSPRDPKTSRMPSSA